MTRAAFVSIWILLTVALVACQALALGRRGWVAGLGELRHRLTRSRLVTGALLIGWMWTGWHFFAR